MRSVTSKDFNIDDFVPMQPAPTAVSSIFFHICFKYYIYISFYGSVYFYSTFFFF